MMGIIVNAGSVLKYLSMILLVFVYMNDCYSNVYENYLTFNKTIIDDIIERTTADLRKIASMPSSQQANTAFHVCGCLGSRVCVVIILFWEFVDKEFCRNVHVFSRVQSPIVELPSHIMCTLASFCLLGSSHP